jgi:hypothetical protein
MRSRNGNKQDPQVAGELTAVDAALAGEPIDPGFEELGELALALRAERPRPRTDYVRELDLLAAEGFPAGADTSERRTREPTGLKLLLTRAGVRRPSALPLAVGSAASIFLIIAAVISSGVFSGDEQRARPEATTPAEPSVPGPALGEDSRAGSAAPSQTSPSGRVEPPQRGGAGTAPDVRNRKVERSASLTLAPPRDKVEDVADDVIRVTDQYEGFVLRSTVIGGDAGSAGGRLDLRIPSNRVQPAIRDLSALAHVRSRTQNTEDVTGSFVSRRRRLSEAIAERKALLRQLARADTPNEITSIRARLRLANREIATRRASLHALQDRIDYASIAVELEPDDSPSHSDDSTLGDGFDYAGDILATSLAVAVVALAILVPGSIIALAAWTTARRLVRHRRERTLDESL